MINLFIDRIKDRGMARTNRYRVTFDLPNSNQVTSELVTLFCDNVTLPGMNISTTPYRIYGESREVPYERSFDPINLTFYVDGQLDVKTAFEKWIHLIQDQNTRVLRYYKEYIRDVRIDVLDLQDNVLQTLTLYNAYPKSLGSITLDAASKDVMKVGVVLQYEYWRSTTSQDIGAAKQIKIEDRQNIQTGTGTDNTFIDPSSTFTA